MQHQLQLYKQPAPGLAVTRRGGSTKYHCCYVSSPEHLRLCHQQW